MCSVLRIVRGQAFQKLEQRDYSSITRWCSRTCQAFRGAGRCYANEDESSRVEEGAEQSGAQSHVVLRAGVAGGRVMIGELMCVWVLPATELVGSECEFYVCRDLESLE
jgi:hypothetical protein